MDYHEHAIGQGANATAITYIEMRVGDGPSLRRGAWTAIIVTASFKAVLSGLNRDGRARNRWRRRWASSHRGRVCAVCQWRAINKLLDVRQPSVLP